MINLKPHISNPASKTQVKVSYFFNTSQDFLIVDFEVETSIPRSIDENFSLTSFSNIGLWNFDVVEVFVRRSNYGPYLELQVSPLGQKLGMLIVKPREEFDIFEPKGSQLTSEITPKGFKSRFKVKVSDIPGSSDSFEGNFFCCLGTETSRSYFAMNINNDKKADYHRPELFVRITNE